MNRIYKVIWNKAKHCYVVTSEIAKTHGGKAASAGTKSMLAVILAATALTGVCLPADAASAKSVAEENQEVVFMLDALTKQGEKPVKAAAADAGTEAETTGQVSVNDSNGFYVKQSTGVTYNSLTKDGLWVGGD